MSRTIDMRTTHIVLSRSTRDAQQIDVLGKQLNRTKILKDQYKKSTSEPIGHLLLVLDTRTTDSLRFRSNIVGPQTALYYILSLMANDTSSTNQHKKTTFFEVLAKEQEAENLSRTFGPL